MNVFQKASFINFEEYGMVTKTDIKHNKDLQVSSKQLDRERHASGSEVTVDRKNSSVVSFDQDHFQGKSVFENFMQQRSSAFTDFVAQQKAKNNGPKSTLTGQLSIEENMTPKTPMKHARQATQEKIKRLAADRIKVSIAKFNEKYSPDARSGDYEKLDKKVL